MDEWTPLDDLGVQEAVWADAPRRFARAVEDTAEALRRLADALDCDRMLDTELDIREIRALPEYRA